MKHFIIGTAGHVDHGKTALIKALTGIDCDTHKEEKDRGITINLGFSHITLPTGESFGIVDVPGHKDFIRTMVAGAYGIDIVMLVIAADSGIMPQTIEHFNIIEMLGVEHGIVVLTKTDLVDEETLELAHLEIAEFLEGTKLENAPVVGVSSVTGKGLDELVSCITEIVPRLKEREQTGNFRMYIDRIFNVKGIGFVVTGSVLEGAISTGSDVYLLPGKAKRIKVRNIERHGEPVDKVYCGDRAALNLAGLKSEDFERGMLLAEKQLDETHLIDATFTFFDCNVHLGLWSTIFFYTGTFECAARMHLLDKDSLQPGETAIVQIHLNKPAILLNKDKFIIRNSSNDLTLGGGFVIDTKPLHHKKRTPKLIGSLKDLSDASQNSDKFINLIKIELNKENAPVMANTIAQRLNKPEPELVEECMNNGDQSVLVISKEGKNVLVSGKLNQDYYQKVVDELLAWHQKNPILEEGLDTVDFIGKLGFIKNEAGRLYLDELIRQIHQDGLIRKSGKTWALAQHQVNIDRRTQEQLDWLENYYQHTGMEVPVDTDTEATALTMKINKDRLKMLQKYLVREQKLIFFDGNYLHRSIVDNCRRMLLSNLITKEKGINEKEFRLLIDGTKKLVQVLQGIYLDEGIIAKRSFFIDITDKGKEMIN